MKKTFLSLVILSGILLACNPKGEKAETGEKEEVATATGTVNYSVDSVSRIKWTGTKPTGAHTGTFMVKQGSLNVENGNLKAGNFTIDINSITDEDLLNDPKSHGMLVGHLKSPDFFDVAKYPEAKFEITGVESADSAAIAKMKEATHVIKGNLTLKDSTKNVAFPARVTIDDQTITAMADFNIDRTEWGMNYKGPDNPADFVISKQVNLKLMITGKKQ
jgi:polyisoprenoid-binding protein YceI